ncbi:copper binding plastocyanin/azurin family protein [Nitrospirillum pindoramense]|uniref:Copper binding plastocyanin/azurin family protein n=2 Tax=Nitrospirillum amazonense TaxID=28077 RepID=A0A560GX36_9PROT|nr:copper binding plastocyanin/azurin family protein [Nitrospirillum amazonense]
MQSHKVLLTAMAAAVFVVDFAQAATVVVIEKDRTLAPAHLQIAQGDTVVFRNEDGMPHRLTLRAASRTWSLDTQRQGQERTQDFTETGHIDVMCDFHPQMTMSIDVAKGLP